jgi:CxxC motif-containing protein (DUF1111 family)
LLGLALAGDVLPPLGGETTVADLSRNAFGHPASNLGEDRLPDFFIGNSFFKRNWVQASASTGARDGLGPLFHARSCAGCHSLDGRAAPTLGEQASPGLLMRLSVPGRGPHGEPRPEPTYGGQFAPQAVEGVLAEGKLRVRYVEHRGRFGDGSPYSRREPQYRLEALGHGPMDPRVLMSPRLAPQIVGMGLLEAIPAQDIEALASAQAAAGGSIRGRVNRVWDAYAQAEVLGRFGWKANVGSVAHQTAAAFRDDIGITSLRFPEESCRPGQSACLASPRGGLTGMPGQEDAARPEIDERTLDKVIHYTRTLAVPAQRRLQQPLLRQGQALFEQAHCAVCHVPRHRTGHWPGEPALSHQSISPYTDLLLHDMGPGLADGRDDFLAGPRDWRTPPLWGIGLLETVNGKAFYLHDGRARNLSEAILWHGGEAEASREAFQRMSRSERAALLHFLKSL